MNFKLLKSDLYTDRWSAVKAAERDYGISEEKPDGFIYACRRMTNIKAGENMNHGYKSETPVWINGCEDVENIYAEAAKKDSDEK